MDTGLCPRTRSKGAVPANWLQVTQTGSPSTESRGAGPRKGCVSGFSVQAASPDLPGVPGPSGSPLLPCGGGVILPSSWKRRHSG